MIPHPPHQYILDVLHDFFTLNLELIPRAGDGTSGPREVPAPAVNGVALGLVNEFPLEPRWCFVPLQGDRIGCTSQVS